jgi:hypothetical protein
VKQHDAVGILRLDPIVHDVIARCELRNQRDTSNFIILVRHLDLKFLNERFRMLTIERYIAHSKETPAGR